VVELLPEVPAAPLLPEVVARSVEEPDVAAPLAGSDGEVPPIPDPLLVAGLLPEVAPLPEVMPLPDEPLVVPYVPAPEVVGVAEVAGSVVDAPLVPSAKAMPPAPSMETKIAMGNFFIEPPVDRSQWNARHQVNRTYSLDCICFHGSLFFNKVVHCTPPPLMIR
jgi:hypothetical protein